MSSYKEANKENQELNKENHDPTFHSNLYSDKLNSGEIAYENKPRNPGKC